MCRSTRSRRPRFLILFNQITVEYRYDDEYNGPSNVECVCKSHDHVEPRSRLIVGEILGEKQRRRCLSERDGEGISEAKHRQVFERDGKLRHGQDPDIAT